MTGTNSNPRDRVNSSPNTKQQNRNCRFLLLIQLLCITHIYYSTWLFDCDEQSDWSMQNGHGQTTSSIQIKKKKFAKTKSNAKNVKD